MTDDRFDVLVVGGGHAGIEAVHAAWRMGVRTLLLTMDPAAIGRMSCNPAVGGVAKGQLVREIDALGGLMGRLADRSGIHFRMLNSSKGPAVWGPRAQEDMGAYAADARAMLESCPGLEIRSGLVESMEPVSGGGFQVHCLDGSVVRARCVVVTSGTFLGARMFTGLKSKDGGRVGEPAAKGLSQSLRALGLPLRRLKTGTPARLDPDSIDFDECVVQEGDPNPWPFSWSTQVPLSNRAVCWITRTNQETHDALRSGFDRSPLFTGVIQGLGPRYCPSIEDKVARFGDRDGHQLFLEPEARDLGRIYVNGFSSSLPEDIQVAALHTIPGLRRARVLQIGYAVEYDAVDSSTLHPTLESRIQLGLFLAGQVCGTSGYEEAAGQGLVAGANAALLASGQERWIPSRSNSYLGVMVDDLVRTRLDEPYRMFTSRAEYRLFLRQDNAAERLTAEGRRLGLVGEEQWRSFQSRTEALDSARKTLASAVIDPSEANPILEAAGGTALQERVRASTLLRRTEMPYAQVFQMAGIGNLGRNEQTTVWADALYEGFREHQAEDIDRMARHESMTIPEETDYQAISTLSMEARRKLNAARPLSVGQASRVAGVRPADVSALLYWLTHHSD